MSTNKPPLSVPCPTCGTAVEWIPENRFKPFCSERCKLIDLGQWATEAYRVPGSDPSPDDDADSDKLN